MRSGSSALFARIVEGGDTAARAERREPGSRLRRRGRRAVPQDVHHPRRHRGPGGAADGTSRAVVRCSCRPKSVSRSQTVFAGYTSSSLPGQGQSGADARRSTSAPVLGVRTTTDRPRLPMVDRERELAVLECSARPQRARASARLPSWIGEPGIGKSQARRGGARAGRRISRRS